MQFRDIILVFINLYYFRKSRNDKKKLNIFDISFNISLNIFNNVFNNISRSLFNISLNIFNNNIYRVSAQISNPF